MTMTRRGVIATAGAAATALALPKRASAQRVPGTGLGLSLVKNTLERYQGTVQVVNASGGGAVFRVTATGVVTLLGNPALAATLGRRGFDRLHRCYTLERCLTGYRDLISDLVNGAPA